MAHDAKSDQGPERYRALGGLPSVVEKYGRGEITLAGVAASTGVTRETVRNDVKALVGEKRYDQLVARRRAARRPPPEERMSLAQAINRLEAAADELGWTEELRALDDTLRRMRREGVPLIVTLKHKNHLRYAVRDGHVQRRGGSFAYALPDGGCVQIRAAAVDGTKKEHELGYHRLKVLPPSCPFTIFALRTGGETLVYVFDSEEIAGVRSLNLRIKDESKYNKVRKSKYDAARDNWAILKA